MLMGWCWIRLLMGWCWIRLLTGWCRSGPVLRDGFIHAQRCKTSNESDSCETDYNEADYNEGDGNRGCPDQGCLTVFHQHGFLGFVGTAGRHGVQPASLHRTVGASLSRCKPEPAW